jgi:hypothetical protein
VVDDIRNVWRYCFSPKGLIRMNVQQCAADRLCRGGGDGVDVGGGRRAGGASFKMKDGKGGRHDSCGRLLEIEVVAPHGGRAC